MIVFILREKKQFSMLKMTRFGRDETISSLQEQLETQMQDHSSTSSEMHANSYEKFVVNFLN